MSDNRERNRPTEGCPRPQNEGEKRVLFPTTGSDPKMPPVKPPKK